MNYNKLLIAAIDASIGAGDAIMEVYESDFAIEHKEDKSPLTLADKKANEVITSKLDETPYPILSEEGKSIPYSERKDWEKFWLVDPLDGTKEFINRNGEFTVNIALIENGKPNIGVIYEPESQYLYFASKENGSYRIGLKELAIRYLLIRKNKPEDFEMALKFLIEKGNNLPIPRHIKNHRPFTAVASRSHLSPETEIYINSLKEKHGEVDVISSGSSTKLCLVAEGDADVYPRLAPTMEWDTAAGQAIVECAGKQVLDYNTGLPLTYNKENLLNPSFIVQ